MTPKKRALLLLYGAAVVALILLAAGLPRLAFQPPVPFSLARQLESAAAGAGLPVTGGELAITLILVFLALAQLLLPLAVIYFLLSKEARKAVLRGLASLVWLIALYLIIRAQPDFFARFALVPESPAPLDTPLLPAEFGAVPPRWLTLVLSLGLGAAIAAAAVAVGAGVWAVWRRGHQIAPPLARIAAEAQEALEALQAGADLKDTVLRCYFDMARVLDEQRGLRREQSMTPREFERALEEAGLPGAPVRQLTRLFEHVRYGARVPDAAEEQQAVAALQAIVAACGSDG